MIEAKRLDDKALWIRHRAGWLQNSGIREGLYIAADECAAQAAARRRVLAEG